MRTTPGQSAWCCFQVKDGVPVELVGYVIGEPDGHSVHEPTP